MRALWQDYILPALTVACLAVVATVALGWLWRLFVWAAGL